jgi:hypothetical protein
VLLSRASSTTSLGGMMQWSLGVGRVTADMCRVEARYGGVNGRFDRGYANLCPEDGSKVDGGEGFGLWKSSRYRVHELLDKSLLHYMCAPDSLSRYLGVCDVFRF